MLFTHPDQGGKGVRLAYCMNAFEADTLDAILAGLRTITVPLRERLAPGRAFGVGLYLPGAVADPLASPPHSARQGSRFNAAVPWIKALLESRELDAFTFNAFPYGRFHADVLKERVFEPTWTQPERSSYTQGVSTLASLLAEGRIASPRHVSISTHSGMHASHVRSPKDGVSARSLLRFQAGLLAEQEGQDGLRKILALEPEPRANCNDTAELAGFRAAMLEEAPGDRDVIGRYLGTCLDTCHAAVEFEPAAAALDNALAHGAPLGKIQYSSALRIRDPAANDAGREQLFSMDEPRYLHQVTGRGPDGLVRAGDLPELIRAWREGDPRWRACDEWRCHFHVPVDLDRFGAGGLQTTRDEADDLLALALAAPERWGTDELHLEIETYTWSVLPAAARGSGELIDGLEREYRHVIGRLEAAGWRSA
jgi:hypothetical protein